MLESRRLRIRPFMSQDREWSVNWHTSEAIRRLKWDGPLTVHDADREFDEILGATFAGDSTYLAVELAATSQPIGQIGLFPSADGSELALAYLIDEPHWRQGFATEASLALIRECLSRQPGIRRIVVVIPEHHAASERVASKLGMASTHGDVRNGMPVRR